MINNPARRSGAETANQPGRSLTAGYAVKRLSAFSLPTGQERERESCPTRRSSSSLGALCEHPRERRLGRAARETLGVLGRNGEAPSDCSLGASVYRPSPLVGDEREMAPAPGLEPGTRRLTAACSLVVAPHRSVLAAFGCCARPASPKRRARGRARSCSAAAGLRASLRAAPSRAAGEAVGDGARTGTRLRGRRPCLIRFASGALHVRRSHVHVGRSEGATERSQARRPFEEAVTVFIDPLARLYDDQITPCRSYGSFWWVFLLREECSWWFTLKEVIPFGSSAPAERAHASRRNSTTMREEYELKHGKPQPLC